ncbi:MAG TPA: hypothetical protein VHF51_19905, partial [Solirubrobacteraceae bacterium]|nr:hypothetical protein [Solirubrobacteraceae bacterium]
MPPAALADGEVVAKAWLLELVGAAPLHDAPAVRIVEVAARGPALAAAVLAAVGAEEELDRLGAGGDRHGLAAGAAGLAGAADPATAAAAVA